MLRASIVLVNQAGRAGGTRSNHLPDDPRAEERRPTRHTSAAASRTSVKTSAARAARGSPISRRPPRGEPTERDHREGRRQQDRHLASPPHQAEVARSREEDDRAGHDREVGEWHEPHRRPEREVQRPPQRDRQDQHRDQDEQCLAVAQVLVVLRIHSDPRQTRQHSIADFPDSAHPAHSGDASREAVRALTKSSSTSSRMGSRVVAARRASSSSVKPTPDLRRGRVRHARSARVGTRPRRTRAADAAAGCARPVDRRAARRARGRSCLPSSYSTATAQASPWS